MEVMTSIAIKKTWPKLMGASIIVGIISAAGTYFTGFYMFKKAFDEIEITAMPD